MYAIESWDAFVIALYISIVILISIYSVRNQKDTPYQYFLSNRNLGWIAIGASIFAANISIEHFIALLGFGATQGLVIVNLELMMIIPLILLGWWIAPIFLKSNIFTVPEYFGKRFNKAVQLYLSGISLSFYLLVKISITLFAGGLILNSVFDWNIYTSAIIILLITGVYTIIGGLTAVIYTSVFQAFIIIIGTITLATFSFLEIGGFSGLQQNLSGNYFSMFKPWSDPNFPWTGIVFGAPILGMWYWCTDQYIVQRILSAKSVCSARNGTILAGFLKTFPVFFIVLVGLITAVIFPGVKGEQVLSSLIYSNLIPVGFKGIIVIGILAALMASLSGAFISSSTLFTMDFYRLFQPDSSDKKLVLVGRLATIVIVISAVLWIPLVKIFQIDLYLYILSLYAYVGPPIAAVFVLGILWQRMTNKSAIWTLIMGGVLGVGRILFESFNLIQNIKQPALIWFLSLNDLHFVTILFVFSLITAIAVSLLTQGQISAKINEYMLTSNEMANTFNWKRILTSGEKTDQIALIFSFILFIVLVGFWGIFF
jgi:SSS family solute:Na+ symporter